MESVDVLASSLFTTILTWGEKCGNIHLIQASNKEQFFIPGFMLRDDFLQPGQCG